MVRLGFDLAREDLRGGCWEADQASQDDRSGRFREKGSKQPQYAHVITPNEQGTPVSSAACWIPRAASAQT